MRFAIACGLVLSLAVPSMAQSQFRADLNATQVVPPTQSNGDGFASFVLNANDTVTYTVKNLLVSGTGASIHTGAVGVSGPLLFTLSGGPTVWSGTTAALTPGDKVNLRSSGLYVQIDSAANPGGDIRGQIVPLPMLFGAHLTGDQETPAVVTSALGDATFVVNSNGTITYNVTTTGLTGTAAHIHTGAFGVGGGVTFALSGGPPYCAAAFFAASLKWSTVMSKSPTRASTLALFEHEVSASASVRPIRATSTWAERKRGTGRVLSQ
jgi:hypothetical protein